MITFIIGLIIVFSILMIYSLLKIIKISNEMEENYERKNKRHSNKSN